MTLSPRLFRTCRHGISATMLVAAVIGTPVPAHAESCANSGVPGTPYQGFGAATPGGAAKPLYRVTTRSDSGPGSLRDAVSKGNRCVVFDVSGDIILATDIGIRGAFITIDGLTAPSPGITLRNGGLLVWGTSGAHDVIIRGIRVRDSDQYACDNGCPNPRGRGVGILLSFGASNVVIDHVSIAHSGNSAIDVAKGAHDITVSNSILLEGKNLAKPVNHLMLINGANWDRRHGRSRRIALHRNLLMGAAERMPQVKWSHSGEQASDTMLDMRNNAVLDWSLSGTQIWRGATANVVNNYYATASPHPARQRRAVYFCQPKSLPPQCDPFRYSDLRGRAHIVGNVSGNGAEVTTYLNTLGTEPTPFPGPAVETTETCTAAQRVLASAGVRPLDDIDRGYLSRISLTACSATSVVNGYRQ